MKTLISIPGKSAVWRYDQICGIELMEYTVSIFLVGTDMTDDARRDYEYDEEAEAETAFLKIVEDFKEALQP